MVDKNKSKKWNNVISIFAQKDKKYKELKKYFNVSEKLSKKINFISFLRASLILKNKIHLYLEKFIYAKNNINYLFKFNEVIIHYFYLINKIIEKIEIWYDKNYASYELIEKNISMSIEELKIFFEESFEKAKKNDYTNIKQNLMKICNTIVQLVNCLNSMDSSLKFYNFYFNNVEHKLFYRLKKLLSEKQLSNEKIKYSNFKEKIKLQISKLNFYESRNNIVDMYDYFWYLEKSVNHNDKSKDIFNKYIDDLKYYYFKLDKVIKKLNNVVLTYKLDCIKKIKVMNNKNLIQNLELSKKIICNNIPDGTNKQKQEIFFISKVRLCENIFNDLILSSSRLYTFINEIIKYFILIKLIDKYASSFSMTILDISKKYEYCKNNEKKIIIDKIIEWKIFTNEIAHFFKKNNIFYIEKLWSEMRKINNEMVFWWSKLRKRRSKIKKLEQKLILEKSISNNIYTLPKEKEKIEQIISLFNYNQYWNAYNEYNKYLNENQTK